MADIFKFANKMLYLQNTFQFVSTISNMPQDVQLR